MPKRSLCPVACGLDIIGDRWTLLVIRDLFLGHSKFGDFVNSMEGISTNILADRLERLEEAGLVSKKPYQDNPPRYAYALTQKGADLAPVVESIAHWGQRHVPGTMKVMGKTVRSKPRP